MDTFNLLMAVLSIALGAIGWLAPRYTMGAIDTQTIDESTMGLSEVRAASGALFVGLGVGALFLGTPAAFAMVGFAWGGAAIGRLTSIILDGAQPTKKLVFFLIEAAVAIPLIVINT